MIRSRTVFTLLCGVSTLSVSQVSAQNVEPLALDPIEVYGDRTTDVAAESNSSLAIIGSEILESPNFQTVEDAFGFAANVSPGDLTESGFVIRGINSEGLTPGGVGAPLASFYVDGVQQTVEGTRRGLRETFDLEQVEVFRGPQSTLAGRNALAGAIYVRTVDPDFFRSGAAQLTYGEDNRREVGLAYGDTLGETLAYRLSGEWSNRDTDLNYPSYERFDRYDEFAEDEYYSVRGKLLWEPANSDGTRVLFSYGHTFDSPGYNEIAGTNWSTGSPEYDERRGDVWGTLLPDYYRGLGLTELPAQRPLRALSDPEAG